MNEDDATRKISVRFAILALLTLPLFLALEWAARMRCAWRWHHPHAIWDHSEITHVTIHCPRCRASKRKRLRSCTQPEDRG